MIRKRFKKKNYYMVGWHITYANVFWDIVVVALFYASKDENIVLVFLRITECALSAITDILNIK